MIGRTPGHATCVASWRVASALLRYPDASLVAALPAIRAAALDEGVPHADEVAALIDGWLALPPIDLEARYVELFDMSRNASLHLTWHQYGDRRQRGLVLSKLKREYAVHDLTPVVDELPDWLPLMLEFAAAAPAPAGAELLQRWRAPIELIRHVLRDGGRPEAVLLDLVSATLPKRGAGVRAAVERLLAEGPPGEEVGLEPFGPESASLNGDSPIAEDSLMIGGTRE